MFLLQVYLSQFGYLKSKSLQFGAIMDEQTLNDAVADFQSFAGLEPTGKSYWMDIRDIYYPTC